MTKQVTQSDELASTDEGDLDLDDVKSTPVKEKSTPKTQSDKSKEICNDCDVCHSILPESSSVWTCTHCDQFLVCNTCAGEDQKTAHDHHTSCIEKLLHKYTIPTSSQDCNCDSCGQYFDKPYTKLYDCMTCDNYILCSPCYCKGMHITKGHTLRDRLKKDLKRT